MDGRQYCGTVITVPYRIDKAFAYAVYDTDH